MRRICNLKLRNSPRTRIFLFACVFIGCTAADLFGQSSINDKIPPSKDLFAHTTLGFSGGMGINIVNLPGVADYLNSVSTSGRTDDFQAAPDFFTSAEYRFTPTFGAKLEYDYMFTYYNVQSVNGPLDEAVQIFSPTFLLQKLYPNNYSMVKLGAGIGYHYGNVQETAVGTTTTYNSSGIGLKGEAEANAALSEALFAYLGADMRLSFENTLRSAGGQTLHITDSTFPKGYRNATLSFFSIGFKLGVIFYI